MPLKSQSLLLAVCVSVIAVLSGCANGPADFIILAPVVSLSPATISFPSTLVGASSSAQTVSIKNTGNANLDITGISITGANASGFTETNTCGSTLGISATCSVAIKFTPASAGTFSAELSIADNAAGSPQSVALTGTGTASSAPQAVLAPAALSFGSLPINATAAAQSVTLSNPGNATLNITGLKLTGSGAADFAITGSTCASTLAALSSCTIAINFTPQSAASFAASLNVTDNAPTPLQTVALSGTGTAAAAPIASLSSAAIAFPSTSVGITSPAQTLRLSNTGTAPLTISGIALGGINPSGFAETTTCGTTLAVSATCTIVTTFTPQSSAAYNATLAVTDNATGSPQVVALTGTGVPTPTGSFTGAAFSGQVMAGSLPIIGATVQIYTTGTGGNGSAGAQRLDTSLVTDSNGAFSVSAYTCPLSTSILYIVATGGPAGPSGTPNSSPFLMSSPGACNTLTSGSSYILNERTTVAGAYAFSQFLATGGQIGSTATNSSGITLAAGTLANLVDISAGTATGPGFPGNATAPTALLDALANLLNACIVSVGSGSSACSGLYSAAAVAGVAPTNTLDAIMNIAQHPAANVAALYTLSTASQAYTPVPTTAPRDWTLFVNFTGGGMNDPTGVAIDSAGRVWVANYHSTASLFSNTGTPVFLSGITGNGLCDSYGAAVDQNDHVWIPNAQDACGASSVTVLSPSGTSVGVYTAGGIYYPFAVAIDSASDAWIANNAHTLTILSNSGASLSGANGYASSTLVFPNAVAVDSNRNGWLANSSSDTVTKVSADGSTFTEYVTGSAPDGVAIDASNNVWVANFRSSSLGLVTAAGVVASGAAGYTGGGLYFPQGIAVDGAGNVWAANYHAPDSNYGDSLTELSGAASATPGTALSPSIGYGTNAGMADAYSLAIDASGNIWVSSFGSSSLIEFIGLAAPVKTPLLGFTHIP